MPLIANDIHIIRTTATLTQVNLPGQFSDI